MKGIEQHMMKKTSKLQTSSTNGGNCSVRGLKISTDFFKSKQKSF